eukprot:TRINITY_DN2802_c0_g2_i1.p3 TRINITY_DN2802_c0_g2~~TRINITY_DN2802_c0_g2_i1.p3  ORF type:complete len:308 (+),score=59.50 TRINITY_DN2802_c0_g2_i1:76-924(+)
MPRPPGPLRPSAVLRVVAGSGRTPQPPTGSSQQPGESANWDGAAWSPAARARTSSWRDLHRDAWADWERQKAKQGPGPALFRLLAGSATLAVTLYYIYTKQHKPELEPHPPPYGGHPVGRQPGGHAQPATPVGELWYVVVPEGVVVREGESLSSKQVGCINHGGAVLVAEQKGRRARITDPVAGWVSTADSGGEPLLSLSPARRAPPARAESEAPPRGAAPRPPPAVPAPGAPAAHAPAQSAPAHAAGAQPSGPPPGPGSAVWWDGQRWRAWVPAAPQQPPT